MFSPPYKINSEGHTWQNRTAYVNTHWKLVLLKKTKTVQKEPEPTFPMIPPASVLRTSTLKVELLPLPPPPPPPPESSSNLCLFLKPPSSEKDPPPRPKSPERLRPIEQTLHSFTFHLLYWYPNHRTLFCSCSQTLLSQYIHKLKTYYTTRSMFIASPQTWSWQAHTPQLHHE